MVYAVACSTTFVLHKHHVTLRHRGIARAGSNGDISSTAHKQPNAFRVTKDSSFRCKVQERGYRRGGSEAKRRENGVWARGGTNEYWGAASVVDHADIGPAFQEHRQRVGVAFLSGWFFGVCGVWGVSKVRATPP